MRITQLLSGKHLLQKLINHFTMFILVLMGYHLEINQANNSAMELEHRLQDQNNLDNYRARLLSQLKILEIYFCLIRGQTQ